MTLKKKHPKFSDEGFLMSILQLDVTFTHMIHMKIPHFYLVVFNLSSLIISPCSTNFICSKNTKYPVSYFRLSIFHTGQFISQSIQDLLKKN